MSDTRCTLRAQRGPEKQPSRSTSPASGVGPVVLIHGDDEYASSDLVGKDSGYRKFKLVDNYIHSVVKTEESLNKVWEDQRLTTACIKGYTLIYDEFNRSRPEANNVLLSVLEGKILNLPNLRRSGEGNLHVHEEFRAILTSNPEEYAGVHKTQDALLDRLITMNLGHLDRETEMAIVMSKSGLPSPDAEAIVDIIRELRGMGVNNIAPRSERGLPSPVSLPIKAPRLKLGIRSLRPSATTYSTPTPRRSPTRASR
jgi:nitric oxide reductase NorQ protein